MCAWEGNAALHFTATIAGTVYPLILGTSGRATKDTTAGGYTLSFVTITPECPRDEVYTVQVRFTPESQNRKVLFVEHFITKDGTGDCVGPLIDFPTYSFNEKAGILMYESIFDTVGLPVKMIYGSGMSLQGAVGGGIGSELEQTGLFPFVPFYDKRVVINEMSDDGTVTVTYNGQTVVLPPLDTWADTTITDKVTEEGCTVEMTTVDRISNFGFLSPDKVIPFR